MLLLRMDAIMGGHTAGARKFRNRNLGNSSAEVPGPNGSCWHSASGNIGLMLQFLWRHAYVFGRVPVLSRLQTAVVAFSVARTEKCSNGTVE